MLIHFFTSTKITYTVIYTLSLHDALPIYAALHRNQAAYGFVVDSWPAKPASDSLLPKPPRQSAPTAATTAADSIVPGSVYAPQYLGACTAGYRAPSERAWHFLPNAGRPRRNKA